MFYPRNVKWILLPIKFTLSRHLGDFGLFTFDLCSSMKRGLNRGEVVEML